MGFTPEDYAAESDTEVWPENWAAFSIFACLSTQWLTAGMAGVRTGLRYEAVYPLIDRAASSDEDWRELFADIRVLEREALETINEKT